MSEIEAPALGAAKTMRIGMPSPLLVLAAACLGCLALLVFPPTLPVGAMYWDLVVYIDGAQRVLGGQTPSVDFFAPVGPIGYWLFAAGLALFPEAQPLLLVQWSMMAVTVPLMALVAAEVDRRSRPVAMALVLPFLAFQLMPMNVEQYSTFPSVDGYGIYNRHVCQILYVLTSALVFSRSQRVLAATVLAACLSLFLLKITGFLTAGLLCAFAFAAGRLRLAHTLVAAALFLAALALLELATGVPSAYIADILALVALNESFILPRFLQAASIHFGIFGSGAFLVLALLLVTRRETTGALGALWRRPSFAGIAALLDRPVLWLGTGLVAGLFFETQNTGGQAFIFLWPILLAILLEAGRLGPRSTILVFALVAATALPPLVNTLHRFSRAMIGQLHYAQLEHRHLGPLGAVTQRPEAIERARAMNAIYAAHPATYQDLADHHLLPTYSLYSDLDFQIGWLMEADEAVGAILAYEDANGVRFDTIMSLNFANPFPYLLDRNATRHIAIGADPFRAVPQPSERTLAAVAATDLVLYPTCPITSANQALLAFYEDALAGHQRVALSPCWIGYIRS